ncbi:MAG: recombinase RecA [Planctomycetota bacterium]|jgi:recombination protein RecA|nr:recombinase RecA [Planctomycetota bacterium]
MARTSDKNSERKAPSLAAALEQIEKQFGAGAVMRLGASSVKSVPVISTGSLGLDLALGVGGYPRGRIVEIYGPESSGKTTLALHAVAAAQAEGGTAAIVDAEHALDPGYAKRLGVDLDSLLVSQPDSGEQALEIVELLIKSNAVDLVVVDSVAALTPKAELEGAMGDSHVGLQARLMSQALRKLTGGVSRTRAVVLFINQIRMQIGVSFGNPEVTPGGRALRFYASLRLDIRRIETLRDADGARGNKVRVKVVKNKVASPFREAVFEILFNRGIHREGELVDLGLKAGLFVQSGSWFSYGDARIGQGRDRAAEFLAVNPDIADEVRAKILAGTAGGEEDKDRE